jgi:hypothetical protein
VRSLAEDKSLRLELEIFLGETQYKKFLKVGLRGSRLLFWQEQAWSQFKIANPAFAVSMEELRVALSICYLHEVVLQSEFVKVFRGNVDYSTDYCRVRAQRFPFAGLDLFSDEGNEDIPDQIEIKFCSKCREEHAAWNSRA